MGSLLPVEGHQWRFQQLYFHNPEHETELRLQHTPQNALMLRLLQGHVHANNSLYKEFTTCLHLVCGTPDLSIVLEDGLRRPSTTHARRYNKPALNEIAAIYPVERDTLYPGAMINIRGGGLSTIAPTHKVYERAGYVLIYLFGEHGWHPALTLHTRHSNRNSNIRLSIAAYTWYLLQDRDDFWNPSKLCSMLRLGLSPRREIASQTRNETRQILAERETRKITRN